MPVASIPDFLDRFENRVSKKHLVVLNRTEPDPVQRLFEEAFGGEIAVEERHLPDAEENTVLLIDDGTVIGSSTLESVMNSFLLINSDTYRTSLRGLEEYDLPEVLSRLDETVVRLRGFPETNGEKLLLIAVSRYVEGVALRGDGGRLDAAFQRLSRLDDEFGTRRVYELLAASATEVHVYGVSGDEWMRTAGPDVTVHVGDTEDYRKSWLVVYTPDSAADVPPAALVAWEVGENVWRSTWTFDPDRVRQVQQYIIEGF